MKLSEFLAILIYILAVACSGAEPTIKESLTVQSAFAIQTQEGKYTNHGTAFLYDGYVISCSHLLHGATTARIRYEGQWLDCVLVKSDDLADVAYFKPAKPIGECASPIGFICMAGFEDRLTQKELPVTAIVKYNQVKLKGEFTHGASGSPIYRDGKLFGMATAYGDGIVSILPVAIIKDLKP